MLMAALPACSALLLQGTRGRAGSVYPVSRVVELLRDMKAKLEEEADSDQELYEKLDCWCKTGEKEKSQSITDGEAHLSDLQATIEKMTALSETLRVEIADLEKEIAANQKSLEVATALREKQKADFIAEEKEMVQSIQALGAAITVLSKHHDGSSAALLSNGAVVKAMALAKAQAERHTIALTAKQQRVLGGFLQRGPEYFGSTPTFKQAYQPQSGEIFGILNQMKATFEADLSESQKEEVAAQQAYDELKEAKETEIKTGQASLQDKKQQLANSDATLAEAKNDREDTEESLKADKAYLSELNVHCALTDKEWEDRKKLRQDEIAALSEAIGILSTDDARDLFSKVYNGPPSLLQVRRASDEAWRRRAVRMLEQVAEKTHSGRLEKLIGSARLDAFVQVKKAIDDMVAELLKEKDEEVKHRDMCISELNDNERTTAKELHTKQNLEAKIEGLHMTIVGLNNTIDQLQAEMENLQQQRERASENREKEKTEYEALVKDQKAAESLLQEAYHALELRYSQGAGSGTALAQRSPSAFGNKPPPEGFKEYEKSGAAPGVLSLIKHIIENTQQMQKEATDAEAAAQDAYTKFVEETTKSIEAKDDAIVDRKQERSRAERDFQGAKGELDGTMTELEALAKTEGDLHISCDFLLKNFEVRQDARDQEVQALRQAKAFLSGMQ